MLTSLDLVSSNPAHFVFELATSFLHFNKVVMLLDDRNCGVDWEAEQETSLH